MDGDIIVQKMLNGVPINDFVAFSLWAFIAMMVLFLIQVGNNAKKAGWSWPAFWGGWKRILVNIILICMGVIFWPNISQFFLESESPIELNNWSSVLLGLSLDRLRSWIKSFLPKK